MERKKETDRQADKEIHTDTEKENIHIKHELKINEGRKYIRSPKNISQHHTQ